MHMHTINEITAHVTGYYPNMPWPSKLAAPYLHTCSYSRPQIMYVD